MGCQNELEHKFDASQVGSRTFNERLMREDPASFETQCFDDVYYRNRTHIVRHRLLKGGELTVKERKSKDSIEDRVEINLGFAKETDQQDVEAFLRLTGYEKMFTLKKHYVNVFHFQREDYSIEVALYSVSREDLIGQSNYRKFIEVEVRRAEGSDYTDVQLKGVLQAWRQHLQQMFGLGDPLNESLLEIYSKLTSPATTLGDPVGTHYRI